MERVDQHLDVDELAREQGLFIVGKSCTQGDRAGARGHLVVDRIQGPGGDQPGVIARIRGYRQLRASVEALEHVIEIVLSDGEFHCRRLHRGDDDNAGRTRGRYEVAWIDQPQADSAGDGCGDVYIRQVE